MVQFLMKTFELLKQKSETKDVEPDSTMKQVSQNKNTMRLDTIWPCRVTITFAKEKLAGETCHGLFTSFFGQRHATLWLHTKLNGWTKQKWKLNWFNEINFMTNNSMHVLKIKKFRLKTFLFIICLYIFHRSMRCFVI